MEERTFCFGVFCLFLESSRLPTNVVSGWGGLFGKKKIAKEREEMQVVDR